MKQKYIEFLKTIENETILNSVKLFENDDITFEDLERVVLDNKEISFRVFNNKEKVSRILN